MRTTFLAVGNAGSNIIDRLRLLSTRSDFKSAQYTYIDNNEDDLKRHSSDTNNTLLLKSESIDNSFNLFEDIDNLIIVSGLGGRIGTKFTELVAKAAKNAGVKDISVVVTIPFMFEGEHKYCLAVEAAQRLMEIPGIRVATFNNDELLQKYSELNIINAFEKADKEIISIVDCL